MSPFNSMLYQEYLENFINEAISNSDGTNSSIATYLSDRTIKGFFVRHRKEQERALADARSAFEEHRHWPREIIISFLGIKK